MQQVLDKKEFAKMFAKEELNPSGNLMKFFECILPLLLKAYKQGKDGEKFSVLPTLEVK